jgi:peptidoglycan-associated lipoprotein
MKANPVASVVVEVTCDSRGSKAYNMMLAEKRAKSVVNFMVNSGIDASRIEREILGAVESEATKQAWANNRRAHFKIK